MAYTPPKVFYSATLEGSYTEITGVQAVNITRGRQRFTDPFSGSVCTIEVIPANSYALPFAIGQFLDIRDSNSGSSAAYFSGRITDVERKYEIPYNSSTGAAPADRIFLTVVGGTGVIGAQATDYSYGFGSDDAIEAVASIIYGVAGVRASYPGEGYPNPSGVIASGQTFPIGSQVFDVVNTYLRTAQWVIDDGDQNRLTYSAVNYACNLYPASAAGTPFAFVDDGTAGFKYSGIDYVSSVQSSFSTVVVEPEGLATQYATSGTLRNGYVFTSYDATTTQAASLASYVLTVSQQTTPTPFVIQTSTAVSDTVAALGKYMTYPVGTAVTVKFRGSTVYATVQGYAFGYYPDMATVQVFLSPSLGTPFTLDSTAFGVLDTNRLGYP